MIRSDIFSAYLPTYLSIYPPIYLSIYEFICLSIYESIHHFCVTFYIFLPGERGGISAADDCHRFTVSDENPSRWNETKEWFRLNTMKFDF